MNLFGARNDYQNEPKQRMKQVSERETINLDELELLIIRCQLGERQAFEQLIRTHHDAVRKYLLRVCSDPHAAADLAQEVWIRVLKGLGGLKDPRRFRPWLFAIAHRQLMDRFRSRYRQAIDDRVDVDSLGDEDDLGVRIRQRQDLEYAMRALSFPDRETLWLFYIEGLTLHETADSLSVPVGTIKSRLHRARKQLRTTIHAASD